MIRAFKNLIYRFQNWHNWNVVMNELFWARRVINKQIGALSDTFLGEANNVLAASLMLEADNFSLQIAKAQIARAKGEDAVAWVNAN
jgi:hypothetical protein